MRSIFPALLCLALAVPFAVWADDAAPKNPFEGEATAVARGNSLFNQNCEHCHGPNAVTGVMPRNLRRLHARHGDDMRTVFYTTVHNGRPAKGMPSWQGVIDDPDLWRIYTFLETVQDSE
jgi:polar amino acid transport system substrate-binding protein